ncbi:hypothetical protein ACEPAG_4677 [Sanghuangporus baumii]
MEDNAANESSSVQNARKTQTEQHAKTTGTPKGKNNAERSGIKDHWWRWIGLYATPTENLAPSATWTTCKYVVKDGHAKPDVHNITGVNNVANAPQSILHSIADAAPSMLYNAAATVLARSQDYSQIAVQFI